LGYEKVVDRLLADPRHGQRWASIGWTCGATSDVPLSPLGFAKPAAHVALARLDRGNRSTPDKGYDRMVLEMLAADEAAPEDLEALRGHRVSWREIST